MWLLYIPFFLALVIGFFYISFQNEKERILLGGLFALQEKSIRFPVSKRRQPEDFSLAAALLLSAIFSDR